MELGIKRIYQCLIILGIVILLFILAFSTPLLINQSDFSIYNPGWNGCSDLAIKTYKAGRLQPTFSFEKKELTLVQKSFVEYSLDPSNSSILIIGPRTSFTSREIQYLTGFLNQGGTLLLADDFGTGNEILEGINASSRFSGDLLLDLSFEKKASFVNVYDFFNHSHPLLQNVSHILLNYPTSIKPGGKASVLAVSTEMSWLDEKVNGKQDEGEKSDSYPVLVVEGYGNGTLVLFSGPSLLINSMKNQLDNLKFRNNLLNYLNRDRVIIDESHRAVSQPFHIAYIIPSTLDWMWKIGIILLVILSFIVGFTPIPKMVLDKIGGLMFTPKKATVEPSMDRLKKEVLERHPDWSRNRLNEIVRRLERFEK
ncbi:MAG: DUF4350 domain-containing protein [Petrotogales bacterium]